MTRARCKRLTTEEWKVHPTSPGASNGQVRTMQARCVLTEGHEDYTDTPNHIFGDWLEAQK